MEDVSADYNLPKYIYTVKVLAFYNRWANRYDAVISCSSSPQRRCNLCGHGRQHRHIVFPESLVTVKVATICGEVDDRIECVSHCDLIVRAVIVAFEIRSTKAGIFFAEAR